MNIEKAKIMTTEEIHTFNTDSEEIVKDLADLGSIINSSGHCSQEIQGRLQGKN